MPRSRSSFDLASAIAAASSLKSSEGSGQRRYEGVPLVSFGPQIPAGRPATPPPAPSRWPVSGDSSPPPDHPAPASNAALDSRRDSVNTPLRPPAERTRTPLRPPNEALPPSALHFPFEDPTLPRTAPPVDPSASFQTRSSRLDPTIDDAEDERSPASSDHLSSRPPAPSGPPRLPDLSRVVSPIVRCERIVSWISEATGATDVFLADSAGLPLAGAIHDVEARLAGSGLVASSIASLVSSIPGNPSPIFEVHLGESPFFQLIGFQVGAAGYIIGLIRPKPLTPRQAQAIRAACRHALGATLGGVA